MKISYAIPVCNELVELERLLNFLVKHKRQEDEITVLYDSENGSKAVEEFLRSSSVNKADFVWYSNPLNKDFAQQKNYLTKMCTGDWIFLIDADEYPDEYLINVLPSLLKDNDETDILLVPRINEVIGITQAHLGQWGWNMSDKGWINYPDYQTRILRNLPEIKWHNKVHEVIKGHKKFATLPTNPEYSLWHPKHITRQEIQNKFYNTI